MPFRGNCSCVIRNGDEIRIFRERGVIDLLRLLKTECDFLVGAYVADKVVGKGAAALMVLGGVNAVFADIVSTPALQLLRNADIQVDYTIEVPYITNQVNTGWCPVELMCRDCKSADECLSVIVNFVEQTN